MGARQFWKKYKIQRKFIKSERLSYQTAYRRSRNKFSSKGCIMALHDKRNKSQRNFILERKKITFQSDKA